MSRACIVLGLVLAACAARVPFGRVEMPAHELYCFTAELRHKKGEHAVGCFDRPALCQEALGTARRWGGTVGVLRLTQCERWAHVETKQ